MRLLVAFDGSEGAQAALREAAALAREVGASVILVQVLNPMVDAADVVAPSREAAMLVVSERTRAALDALVRETSIDGTATEVLELRHGEDISEALVRAAEDHEATMVVIGARRAGSIVGMILGSVTQAVLWSAPCPVLVVRG